MRLILILTTQLLVYTVLAQEITYPYVHDLKGAVQECSEKKYAPEFAGDKIVAGRYIDDDKIGIRLFDNKGRLTEFRAHADSSGMYEKTVLTYLESGCLAEMKEYHKKGWLEMNSVYKCDRNGYVIEEIEYYYVYEFKPISITAYKYDGSGHITETHKMYGTPKATPAKNSSETNFVKDQYERHYNEYDKNGFRVKWSIKREGIDPELADLLGGTADVVNDAQGRPVSEYSLNNAAAKEGKKKKLSKEMQYNEKGFLSKIVQYTGLGLMVTYFEYTYDEHNNWVTRIETKSSSNVGKSQGVADNITVREIKYY